MNLVLFLLPMSFEREVTDPGCLERHFLLYHARDPFLCVDDILGAFRCEIA